ncbi:MAG: glycosyltransferase, partial [Janthinobacterium lividum]
VLDAAGIDLVVIHQLLGFGPGIVEALGRWSRHRRAIAYIHDFYSACPRVTLINAVDNFCGVQSADVCDRCVAMGGAHEASRMTMLSVGEHRALFNRVLSNMRAVVAPSADAARMVARAFPTLRVLAVPHPEHPTFTVNPDRPRDPHSIALLGGIGPHKGADRLLELARVAALSHPALHFHVIGHTSQDDALEKLPNVSITGQYEPAELPALVEGSRASIALFLHVWPETYSYTLTEAVEAGMLPVVPDIGAPAERVRETGWGRVFNFPMVAGELLGILDELGRGALRELPPLDRFHTGASIPVLRDLFSVSGAENAPSVDQALDEVVAVRAVSTIETNSEAC